MIRPAVFRLTVLVALLLAGRPALSQAPNAVVSDVAVVGNANISREAILGVVSIKSGSPFSVEAVNRDVAAIRDLGYFQSVTHHEEDTGAGVRVIFEVVENQKVTAINVTGNTKVPTADILAAMTTKVGDVLNVSRFTKDLDRIQQIYKDRGFLAYVDVNQSNYISADGALNVPIVEVKIEKFIVENPGKTKPYVLLREIHTKPGEVYDAKKLMADLQRIYSLNILDDIQYHTEPGTAQDQIVIVLEPKNKKTGQVELGFGYSSEQGLIGRVGLSESNLKGTGTAVGVSAEVGGRFRSAGVPPLSIEANYYQPYIDRRDTSLSVSLYNKTTYRFSNNLVGNSGDGQAFEVRRGGSVGLGRPLSETRRLQLTLRNDNIKTYSAQTDFGSIDVPLDNRRGSNVASVGLSLVADTRDVRLDPAKGYFFTVGSELGHTRLGKDPLALNGDNGRSGAFFKPALDYRRYFGLKPRKALNAATEVLAFRIKGGTASGPLSFFDQYFVGGADSLRGYSEDRFWGKNSLLANAELRMPFGNSLQGVLFVDAGDAWGSDLRGDASRFAKFLNWYEHGGDSNGDGIMDDRPPTSIYDQYEYRFPQHDSFELHTAFGFGVRVKTPIGPLRLDYGISKEGRRTHFSISQAF
jgi:outer membrane protein insertion porin family